MAMKCIFFSYSLGESIEVPVPKGRKNAPVAAPFLS